MQEVKGQDTFTVAVIHNALITLKDTIQEYTKTKHTPGLPPATDNTTYVLPSAYT